MTAYPVVEFDPDFPYTENDKKMLTRATKLVCDEYRRPFPGAGDLFAGIKVLFTDKQLMADGKPALEIYEHGVKTVTVRMTPRMNMRDLWLHGLLLSHGLAHYAIDRLDSYKACWQLVHYAENCNPMMVYNVKDARPFIVKGKKQELKMRVIDVWRLLQDKNRIMTEIKEGRAPPPNPHRYD